MALKQSDVFKVPCVYYFTKTANPPNIADECGRVYEWLCIGANGDFTSWCWIRPLVNGM